jgi:hypothetical protein
MLHWVIWGDIGRAMWKTSHWVMWNVSSWLGCIWDVWVWASSRMWGATMVLRRVRTLVVVVKKFLQRFQLALKFVEVVLGLDDILTAAAAEEWSAHGARAVLDISRARVVGLWYSYSESSGHESEEDDCRLHSPSFSCRIIQSLVPL